jgi:hypothetical protein
MNLFLLNLLAVSVVASYDVDPVMCSSKIEDSDCFLQGTLQAHKFTQGKSETCMQCLLKSSGIASWGCTLAEMREWCTLGFEEAPEDVEEEEEEDPTKFVAAHGKELKELKAKMHKGLATFASILAKFDTANPDYTEEESKIMDNIVNHNKSPAEVISLLSAAKPADEVFLLPSRLEWENFQKENRAFRTSLYKSKGFNAVVKQGRGFKSFVQKLKKNMLCSKLGSKDCP